MSLSQQKGALFVEVPRQLQYEFSFTPSVLRILFLGYKALLKEFYIEGIFMNLIL